MKTDGSATITQHFFPAVKDEIHLNTVAGKKVVITLAEDGTKLVPVKNAMPANIRADETIILSDYAQIGATANPLTIVPYTEGNEASLLFKTRSSDILLNGDAVICLDGNGAFEPLPLTEAVWIIQPLARFPTINSI